MPLPLSLSHPIYTLVSLASPFLRNSSTRVTCIPISHWSRLHQLEALCIVLLPSTSEPIFKLRQFSPYHSGSYPASHAKVFRPTVNVGNHEEGEIINLDELEILKQKIEVLGIKCSSCQPADYNYLICPKCNGGKSMERSLSFHISQNKDFAMWRCFRIECSWAGQVFSDNRTTENFFNQYGKAISSRQRTKESLKLEPLGDELIAYFSGRKISKETLQKNAVMQISGDQNIIAFPYRRNGEIVGCKYRNIDKIFWQKGTEKVLYGLDDIMEADEIIIVEGEIDKLSMEEAGFRNCVSVPSGAPQKVSNKGLPSLEKDTQFQYLWSCKEYLDKASRIILATDGDMPGQALAEELVRRLGRERCWQVNWPKKDECSYFKDANEVLKNLGSDALRDIIDNAELYKMQNSK